MQCPACGVKAQQHELKSGTCDLCGKALVPMQELAETKQVVKEHQQDLQPPIEFRETLAGLLQLAGLCLFASALLIVGAWYLFNVQLVARSPTAEWLVYGMGVLGLLLQLAGYGLRRTLRRD